jgi:endonuclease YncB( thermonuclease family)
MPDRIAARSFRFVVPKEDVMKQRWARRALWTLIVLGAAGIPASAGDSLYGKVTAVKEATLVTLDYGSGTYEIRLVGIDALKPGEARADEALKFVSDLLLGKNARMRLHHRDQSGEMVCRLFTDDPVIGIKEVGVELLRAGLARRQPGYDEKYGELAAAEDEARTGGRGIWAAAQSR